MTPTSLARSARALPFVVALLVLVSASVRAQGRAQVAPSLVIGGEDDKGVELAFPLGLVEVGRLLVIMEANPPYLRVLTRDGRHVQTLGRSGQGPGEFERPIAVMTDGVDRVMLVDRNARLTTFIASDSLVLSTMQRLPHSGMSACAVGRTVWVLYPNEKGILHEMRGTGPVMEPGRSVGNAEPPHPALKSLPVEVRRMYASGALSCDRERNTAWIVSWGYGDIRTIPLDGGPQRWHVQDDFIVQQNDPDRPKSADAPGNPPFDQTVSAALVPDGLLFAIGRRRTERGERESMRSYHLTRDGQRARLSATEWEPMLHGRSGTYCYRRDPVPTLALFAGNRCP